MKIIGLLLVPVISLVALWGVLASVTARESLDLRTYSTLWSTLRNPAEQLVVELQAERLTSARFLGDQRGRPEMIAQRTRTDDARQSFRAVALDATTDKIITDAMREPLEELLTRLHRLEDIRAEIDAGLSNRVRAIESYSAVSESLFRFHRSLSLIDDIPIYQQSRVVISLGYAKELLTREQAIAAGGLTSGRMTDDERWMFTQTVGNRRFLIDQALAELDRDLREFHVSLITTPTYQQLRILEERIISGGSPKFANWQSVSGKMAKAFQEAQDAAGPHLAQRAEPIADSALLRAFALAGAGLLVVLASIVISLRLGSRLSGELAGLRQAALDLAQVRLPRVVERLRRAEEVDVSVVAPPISIPGATAEIHDVGRAFSAVQRTAIEAAVGQAQLRAGVSQVFLNLARRSQTLLHRQRIQLDGMQRRATDPGSLDDLFRLDHLTTRMRRHAEGLIILSGAVPGRGWRKPVPMIDVARGAAAEVEDYARVNVMPMSRHALVGSVVGDVIHLVAELIENATVYSPPHTSVQVQGEMVANGFAIEIEDRGLGLNKEQLAELNERLANPPEFDLADSDRLGLFVVARLAARHHIRVTLRTSPYGGTTAIVLIPLGLVVAPEESDGTLIASAQPGQPAGMPSMQPGITPILSAAGGSPPGPADAPGHEGSGPAVPSPAPPAAGSPPRRGPTGLPRRARQANLAPQLRGPRPESGLEAGDEALPAPIHGAAPSGTHSDGRGHHGRPGRGSAPGRPQGPAQSHGQGDEPDDTAGTGRRGGGPGRSPEESSFLLTSLQQSWTRGRRDAEPGEEGDT